MKQSVGKHIVRASLVVALAHICLKFTGLIQTMVVAKYVSSAIYDSIYVVAFEGIIFSVYLTGEEVIGPSFLPVFMGEKDKRGDDAAWSFANVVLSIQLILLFSAIVAVMCFPDAMLALFTQWDRVNDAAKWQMARQGVFWLGPSLLCLSLGSTTYMLLNGHKKFFLAAFGDASWKICVVIALAIGMGLFGLDYRVLIFGLLVGSVAKLLTHLVGLRHHLGRFRFSLDFRNPALRAMLLLVLPLILGIVVAKFRDIFNNVYILTSIQSIDGLLQANSMGRKLYLAISWLVPYAVSIAMFPFFCELVDRDDKEQLGAILTKSGRTMLAFFIPVALVVAVLARPLAIAVFLRGKLHLQTAEWTALSTACYTLVLPAFALEYILIQGFFAKRKVLSTTIMGIVFSFVSVGISFIFITVIGVTPTSALAVVALGFVVSRTLKSIAFVVWLKREIPLFPLVPTLGFLARVALLGLATAAAAWGAVLLIRMAVPMADVYAALEGAAGAPFGAKTAKLVLLGHLAAGGIASTLVFVAGSLMLRLREPFTMLKWGLEKVLNRMANPPLGRYLRALHDRL